MTNTTSKSKINAFLLSEQVKTILHEKGQSKIFNYQDYEYFKKQCLTAFNKAQAIADKFTADYCEIKSDINEYIF